MIVLASAGGVFWGRSGGAGVVVAGVPAEAGGVEGTEDESGACGAGSSVSAGASLPVAGGLGRIGRGVAFRTSDDDVIAGIGSDSSRSGYNINEPNLAVGFVHHGTRNGSNDGDGPIFLFLHGDGDFGVRDQAIGFENFLDFALGLHLGQAGDVQAHRNQRETDGTGLTDTQFAGDLGNVEDLDGNQIAGANDVIAGRHSGVGTGCERTKPVICLLRCLNSLRAAGRRQGCEQGASGQVNDQRTQSCWLHRIRRPPC